MDVSTALHNIRSRKYTVLALDSDNTLYHIKNPKEIYRYALDNLRLCLEDTPEQLYEQLKNICKDKKLSYVYLSKQFWFALLSLISNITCKQQEGINSKRVIESLENGFEIYQKFVSKLLDSIEISKIGKNLPRLSELFKIVIVSEEEKSLLLKKLSKINALPYIDLIISSSDVGVLKPDEKYFSLLIEELSIDKSEILYVDDSERNVVFAEKYGVDSMVKNNFEKVLEEILEV